MKTNNNPADVQDLHILIATILVTEPEQFVSTLSHDEIDDVSTLISKVLINTQLDLEDAIIMVDKDPLYKLIANTLPISCEITSHTLDFIESLKLGHVHELEKIKELISNAVDKNPLIKMNFLALTKILAKKK